MSPTSLSNLPAHTLASMHASDQWPDRCSPHGERAERGLVRWAVAVVLVMSAIGLCWLV